MMNMKKLSVIGAIALVATLFTACGGKGGSTSSVVKNAVKTAEEAVTLEESPVYGKIPSLQLQYDEAKKAIKEHFKEAQKEIESKFKDGGKMEDAIREAEKLKDERKAAEDELKQLFKGKIADETATLAGKSIPVKFDENQYSAATVVFVAAPDSSITQPLHLNVELTLAAPIVTRVPIAYVHWNYLDANDNDLEAGAKVLNDFQKLTVGDKLPLEIIPSFKGEKALKFAHLYFKKAD